MLTETLTKEIKREKTKLVLKNIYNLPPMPKAIFEIMKLLENKCTSVTELNKVISKDQSLVSKILLIANSPLYGLQRRVTSIEYAIMILGLAELKNIISVLSFIESFRNKTDNYLNQKEYWLHSFMVGTAAKKISIDLNIPKNNEIFIAGFLHDIGISVMHRFLHSSFISVRNLVETAGKSFIEAEEEVLGMNHAEMGHFLGESWNFPELHCDIILNHHDPTLSENNVKLVGAVHLADLMTQKFQMGSFIYDKELELNYACMKEMGFSTYEDLEDFITKYEQSFYENMESIRFIF